MKLYAFMTGPELFGAEFARNNAVETHRAQVELLDKRLDDADWIFGLNVFFHTPG
jgi:hypothetical protein